MVCLRCCWGRVVGQTSLYTLGIVQHHAFPFVASGRWFLFYFSTLGAHASILALELISLFIFSMLLRTGLNTTMASAGKKINRGFMPVYDAAKHCTHARLWQCVWCNWHTTFAGRSFVLQRVRHWLSML